MWRRPSTILVVITAAVVVVGVTAGVLRARGGSAPAAASSSGTSTGGSTLLNAVEGLDPAVMDAVGSGSVTDGFSALKAAPPLVDSTSKKPIVLAVSSEPCADCAAMRWSLVVALSRFGDFASLPLLPLAAGASNPALATFSFSGATFSSEYVDFVGVELKDQSGKPLQSLGSEGQQLLTTYDAPPYVAAGVAGFIPWLDVANKYAMQGSGYSPAIIGNLDWGHIATRLGDATDPVTKAIVGAANYITAAICTVTSMHPASVCQGAPIGALIAHLSAAAGNGGQP